MRIPWTTQEHMDVLNMEYDDYLRKYGSVRRTYQAFLRRKQHLMKGDIPIEISEYSGGNTVYNDVFADNSSPFTVNKKEGRFNWREANEKIRGMQELSHEASGAQDTAHFVFDTDERLKIIVLGDTHIGSWGTDHTLLERITDEILSEPNPYIAFAGDLLQMAIRLRGVIEVSDNLLTPRQQQQYVESWFEEIAHRVLFAGWDNHVVVRQEEAAGSSELANFFKRNVVYFNGIGHADITVGDQTYRLAVSHKFQSKSQMNPVYGPQKYLVTEGTDREIALAGDSHVPGLMSFMFGRDKRLAVNCGSIQTNSGYAKRYFSLFTHPIFPVITLHPTRHSFVGYWNLEEMRDASQGE